jgi:uncharacterized protein
MNIKTIFIDPNQQRLRAGWRLLIQTIFMTMLGIVGQVILFFVPAAPSPSSNGLLIFQLIELIGVTASIFLMRRLFDRRSLVSLGLKINLQMLKDLFVGMLIPVLMMGSIYLLEWSFGWLEFQGFAWDFETPSRVISKTLPLLLAFILVGWNEELLSRGYHLQTLASGLNLFWGVIISAIIFAVLHLGNPHSSWISTLGIILAGLFLGYAYLRTKQLWLPIGLHIGWNFFEAVIFGFPVSGMDLYSLIQIRVSGPEIITGGAFGPEAGLVLLPALLVGTVFVRWYTRLESTKDTKDHEEPLRDIS